MTDNVETNKTNGKKNLADFLKGDNYEELKEKIKFDILSDPRLHSLHELFLLFEKMDRRMERIENRFLDLEVEKP